MRHCAESSGQVCYSSSRPPLLRIRHLPSASNCTQQCSPLTSLPPALLYSSLPSRRPDGSHLHVHEESNPKPLFHTVPRSSNTAVLRTDPLVEGSWKEPATTRQLLPSASPRPEGSEGRAKKWRAEQAAKGSGRTANGTGEAGEGKTGRHREQAPASWHSVLGQEFRQQYGLRPGKQPRTSAAPGAAVHGNAVHQVQPG